MAAEPAPAPFSGAVLAGGASTRMGTDKALIGLGPRRLVEVATDALRNAGAREVFVVGGDRVALEGMGLRVVPDEVPGAGPLGGVITALRAAAEEVVVILACDHVATDAAAVRWVRDALGGADVAVAVIDGHPQVLHAAWNRRALAALDARFATGARSVRDGLVALDVVQVSGADRRWFRDVDTPTELADAAGNAISSPESSRLRGTPLEGT